MARPEKMGLAYFNVDTDIFHNRKIRRLLKNYGANGFLIYTYILTEIYRDKGHFIEWDEDTAFDVADSLRVKETLVENVILYCCSVGLFNKELLTNEKVLTNFKIQEFWVRVSKAAGRKNTRVKPKINLLNTIINQESTPNTEESTVNNQESTQRKVKKSKVKKTIEGREANFKKQVFSNTQFSKEILQSFFYYWSEKNQDSSKMKFEAQDFFEIKTRLKNWRKNESKWHKNQKTPSKKRTRGENLTVDHSLEAKMKEYDT
ncbi:DUF4373 domain-containing protein [Tenacibaculum aiptasiae]|uniref:DUF4373 domain-containing protein n=1 Tax=Tenacibaculum aiptasiae TaxID=426481 RepID=UPI00232D2FD6|nr:DUF4373 domain-containing protein [Tenacibaculum aiptasiae]